MTPFVSGLLQRLRNPRRFDDALGARLRSRVDGFGGGAHVLDLATSDTLTWLDCDEWLRALLDPAADPRAGVVLP